MEAERAGDRGGIFHLCCCLLGGTKYVPWNVWIIPESLEFRQRHRGEDPRPGIKELWEQCGGLGGGVHSRVCGYVCVLQTLKRATIFEFESCFLLSMSYMLSEATFNLWELLFNPTSDRIIYSKTITGRLIKKKPIVLSETRLSSEEKEEKSRREETLSFPIALSVIIT